MAEPTPSLAPAPTPIKRRILDRNFGVSTFKFNRWSAELEEAETLDDALDPTFWATQVGKLMGHDKTKGRGDIIEVRKADTGLYAELLVTEIGVGFIKVKLIARAGDEAVALPKDAAFTTRWNPGKKTHEVIRRHDNTVMVGGFQSKLAAADWIADHLKAMAA